MNRFSRIRHHVDMKDVKQRHLEENVAKKIEEKQIEEEKRIQKEIYDAWKSDWRQDILDEGMTTQMLHGILPGTGETDLENILTGGQDDNGIFTAFSIMGDMTTAEDPTGVGCWFRHPDNDFGNPSRASRQSTHGGTYSGAESSDSASGKEGQVPGYVPRAMRGVRPSGIYSQPGPYQPIHLNTIDELGLDRPRTINFALDTQGFGTHLDFGESGYMATRDIDTTEFDTMKIHAWVHSGQIKNENDKVELFYWAGNKPGFKSMWTGAPYNDGEGHESGHLKNNDGWRRINTKPDGTVDNSVKTRIIDHLRDGSKNGRLSAYTIHLPEWTRGKNSRFIITSFGQFARLKMTSMRFQRKNALRVPSISKPLTDVEAAPFVRVGQSVDQNAEQRKKKVRDMIKASIKYGETKFGKGMLNSTNISESKKDSFEKDLKYVKEIYSKWKNKLSEEIYDKWKSNWRDDILDEGMSTQMLTGILPSAGNTDLDVLQLGATGSDLTYTPNTLDSVVDGEFTALTNLTNIDRVNDPLDIGTNIRSPLNGASISLDFTDQDPTHTHNTLSDPPYVPGDTGGTRGVDIAGSYSGNPETILYTANHGATNENIPFNDFNGEDLEKRVGTFLGWGSFGSAANPGFPRYAALKAVDTTEMDTFSMNWFARGIVNTDSVDGSPTQGQKIVAGNGTIFREPGDGVSLFYWAGDKEGAKSYAPARTGHSKLHDGWRPINVRPDGVTDNSYDPWLIPHKPDVALYGSGANQKHTHAYPREVLLNNKLTLPPWCRDKNTRFLLHQGRNSAGSIKANFGITSIRFQRRSPMRVPSISKPLTDIEAAPFVRVGQNVDQNADQRRKRVRDMIKASLKYGQTKFGDGVVTSTNID